MQWEAFKQRVTDSAIEFALSAFWVGVWGALVTGAVATYLLFKGSSPYLLIGLASAAATFVFVLVVTAAIVLMQRRRRRASLPMRAGRKGFLDYKMQGQRALNRMAGNIAAITRLMKAVGEEATAGSRRTLRAQQGWAGTDERAYRAIHRTAERLDKRASAMKLHAANYASDTSLFIEGFEKWTKWVVGQDGAGAQRLQVATMLENLRVAATAQIPHLERFRSIVEGTRNISEHMDLAGQSLTEAVTVVTESTNRVIAFCAEQEPLLRRT